MQWSSSSLHEATCVWCRSADLLAVVFERFPDRDYLLITVPHMVPEFNLLQHFVVRAKHSYQLPIRV